MNAEVKKQNQQKWYVMCCRKAADVVDLINAYNLDPQVEALDRIDNFFVPATAIQRKPKPKFTTEDEYSDRDRAKIEAVEKNNTVRNALRNFVFLLIRPSGLEALRNQRWNAGNRHIYHYRDLNGDEVTATQAMMDRFIDACLEFGNKLEICTLSKDIKEGIKVKVRDGAFAGLDAEVVSLQYKADGLRFTIAVRLFADGNYAYVHDQKPEDVIVADNDSFVFNSDFIEGMENAILTILRRKIKHREDKEERANNDEQIRQYYRLHRAAIASETIAIKFDALMAICAAMLRIDSAKSRYIRNLKRRAKELRRQVSTLHPSPSTLHQESPSTLHPSPSTLHQESPSTLDNHRGLAYCLAALFFTTRDAAYRSELKKTVQDHLSNDDTLRRYVAILRQL